MVDESKCLFCRIARGEIPAKKVYEDADTLAFLDINPRNPGHTLVIPKKHYETLMEMPDGEAGNYFASIKKLASMVMKGVNAQGISVANSNGQAAGQVVAHVHFHVIPRFSTETPPGLESILSSKRLDEKTMDQIAEGITKASGKPTEQPRPEPEPVERPSLESVPKPSSLKQPEGEEHKKKQVKKEFKDFEDEDGISFDF
ncbi:MAG: hypothetical protein DRO99_00260 [Candidatus Aenigmatarchaeota archaeon]|nr:MAG: hypothetical protein DRO99_00260 [Candidatus Aenigmarchaeota archaeon]